MGWESNIGVEYLRTVFPKNARDKYVCVCMHTLICYKALATDVC